MADEEFWRRFLDAHGRVKTLSVAEMVERLKELRQIGNFALTEDERRDVERLVAMGEAVLLNGEPNEPC